MIICIIPTKIVWVGKGISRANKEKYTLRVTYATYEVRALDFGSCGLLEYAVEAGILHASIFHRSIFSQIINCHISFILNPAYVKIFPVVLLSSQTVNYSKLRGMELPACL